MRRRVLWALALVPLAPLACTLAFDVGPAPFDGGVGDVKTESVDAPPGDSGGPGFDDPGRWSLRIAENLSATIGWGAAFDPAGRYLYLPREQPDASPLFARYSVNEPFADAAVATTELAGYARRYVGGACVEGDMLFLPDEGSAFAMEFASSQFADASAWPQTLPVKATVRGIAVAGGCAVGAPKDDQVAIAHRCKSVPAWSARAGGLAANGATALGDFIYFAPNSGTIFNRVAATELVDGGLESVDLADAGTGAATKFAGAVASKDSLFFLPAAGSDGVVVRYDTTKGKFTDPSAWSRHIITGTGGFFGGVFDGRYVYLVPAGDAKAYRYDTRSSSFDDGWESHAITGLPKSTTGFHGGAFDGRYVYFVGADGGAIARFDTLPDGTDAGDAGPAPSFF